MDDWFSGYDAGHARTDEFEALIDGLLDEEIDRAQRRRPPLNEDQQNRIRTLANAIAEAMAHTSSTRRSRKDVHDRGIARRAQGIARSALRDYRSGAPYTSIVQRLQERLDSITRFDEFTEAFDDIENLVVF